MSHKKLLMPTYRDDISLFKRALQIAFSFVSVQLVLLILSIFYCKDLVCQNPRLSPVELGEN